MPNLQQQQPRNRRARLHTIREEPNWLHTMQRTYLGLAMTRYAQELILERRNRNYRREVHESQATRLNFTLTPRSLVLTMTEPHLQKILAQILVFVFGCVLGICVQMTCVYFMVSGERVKATSLSAMGLQFVEDVACGNGRSEIQTENDGLHECDRIGSLDFGNVAECEDILSDAKNAPDDVISS
ncbi:hypothetical protein BELL_0070g00110 [Botrytis elliptica]|uniref:Uncharacterized protein n=1 Tax=Botrytis elliptica TaxID=278938 RepID=A0A4Z1JY11_9HELO|nr:hypothetical protein BELL_0070g00110 [Botrytis elliptica]